MNRSHRKTLAEYVDIVALYGADSPAAESFRRARDGDEDFAQLARLTDFLFEQYDLTRDEIVRAKESVAAMP
jgi:hypothetical protein